MKTKTLLLILAFMAGCLHSDAFRLVSTPMDSIVPVRNIIQDETGVTVSYEFPGAVAVQDNLYPESVNISIPGFGQNTTLGEPAWPLRIDSFEIPEGCDAEVSVVSSQWTDLGVSLAPSRPMLVDSSDEVHSLENVPPVSDFAGVKPFGPVAVNGMQTYRDRNILYVEVVPTKCINKTHTKACESLTYRVTYKASESEKLKKLGKIRHDVDEGFMSSLFTSTLEKEDTTEDILKVGSITQWRDAPYYLILSIPEYQSAVSDLAAWKKCMGFNVKTIYSDSWTTFTIKSEIQNFYDQNSNLQYVLLVGDALTVPPVRHPEEYESGFWHYEHSSDYTYGCMDGEEDMEQDVIVGRLNVSNQSEASVVVNKIINYQQTPPSDNSFYENAYHAASFEPGAIQNNYEDRRFTKTSEDIRNGLQGETFNIKRIYSAPDTVFPTNWNRGKYGFGEAIPDDLLRPGFTWNGSTSHITSSINDGCFYAFHRGHGSYSGCLSPSFNSLHLPRLNNGSLLPVFFIVNCQSGAFGHTKIMAYPVQRKYLTIKLSFSEALLRKENGGAVGIIAASETSYSGANDVLAMEMFQSIWPKASILTAFMRYYSIDDFNHNQYPVYALGQVLKKGLSGLSERYTGKYIEYTKHIYHCFGDPSMCMYTAKPHAIRFSTVLGNRNAIATNESVSMAIIMKDGSVKVARGQFFDTTSLGLLQVEKSSIFGHNIIPIVSDNNNHIQFASNNSSITYIRNNGNGIEVKYDAEDESSVIIRVRPVNSTLCLDKQQLSDCGVVMINTSGLVKGVYIVELIENGVTVDNRKVVI